ncbi:vestigial like 4 like [Clupea harengus]|uniref:Vestigial like 4 like n=1 Tax=Clupea harengus TaxID=7950 RepID=A0A6P8FRE2_CLUHA|nr:vestigial like 4 like [Clupea harengus]
MAVTNFHYITRMNSGFKVYILEGQPHLRSEDRYRHVTSERVRLIPAHPVKRKHSSERKHHSERGLTLEERRERTLSKHAAAVRRMSVVSGPESPSSTSTWSPSCSPTTSPLACPAYAAPMLDEPLALIKKPRREQEPEAAQKKAKAPPAPLASLASLASPASPASPTSQLQIRPSVITCVPSVTKSSRGPLEHRGQPSVLSERSCDGVEEHFQRSLGAHYHKSTPPLSISASVDNHFAKALGDKWHQIKGSSSSTSSSPTTPSPTTSSSCGSSSPSSSSSPPSSPIFLYSQRHVQSPPRTHAQRGPSRSDARPSALWVIK